jgi:hypothetical protein
MTEAVTKAVTVTEAVTLIDVAKKETECPVYDPGAYPQVQRHRFEQLRDTFIQGPILRNSISAEQF